jgi:hypothetical protein
MSGGVLIHAHLEGSPPPPRQSRVVTADGPVPPASSTELDLSMPPVNLLGSHSDDLLDASAVDAGWPAGWAEDTQRETEKSSITVAG